MVDEKDTNIHKPDGFIISGEKVGHVDNHSQIRKKDGFIFRGEEIGYVDKDGNVRRPDGIIFQGETVGQVKGNAAYEQDGFIFSGEQWGYVDEDGNVRQRDGIFFKGRIIGKMKGKNKAGALGYYILRFNNMEKNFAELQNEVRTAQNKGAYLGKVRHMIEYVPKADALGDFGELIKRLKSLEQEILNHLKHIQEENRSKKEALIHKAESLSTSTEWKETAAKLHAFQEDWKNIGSAGKDYDENLWKRFRTAQDKFYQSRTKFFEKCDQERAQNRSKKEALIHKAESLSISTEWKETAAKLQALQEDWKNIGSAGKEYDENLWDRFRAAQDKFYQSRTKFFEKCDQERVRNRSKKEALCSQAESLRSSTDYKIAVENIKSLQEQWKQISSAGREYDDGLWQRFRAACDLIFENSRREHERKQAEWKSKMRETLFRKREQTSKLRESIAHDEDNISRWQSTIYNIHDGKRAGEIRSGLESKISDVRDKIRSKRDRLYELEQSIREIESKL